MYKEPKYGNNSLYYSLCFTIIISLLAIFNNSYTYYILLIYLISDTIRYIIYDNKNITLTIIIHHIIGIYCVYFVYIYPNMKYLIDNYLLYEISTIFLNIYLLNKNTYTFIIFFTTFTLIRIMFGTSLLFNIINSNIFNYIKFIAILFQLINYYWFSLLLLKINRIIN